MNIFNSHHPMLIWPPDEINKAFTLRSDSSLTVHPEQNIVLNTTVPAEAHFAKALLISYCP